MIEHRWEIKARLEEGMTEEGWIDGSALQLVTVCLCDEGAGEISDAQGRPVAPRGAGGQLRAPGRGARSGVPPACAGGAGRAGDGGGR